MNGREKMIYALLDKNIGDTLGLIYFSDKARDEEELERTELLYTSDIVDLDDIRLALRPWIALEVNKEREYYRRVPEIKEYLETGKLDNVFYTRIHPTEALKEVESFYESFTFLRHLGCVDIELPFDFWQDIKDRVVYDCDVYNYLERRYTRPVVDIVYSYKSLDTDEKKFLKEFEEIGTRDKKYEYLKKNLPNVSQDVLDFLPLWYRLSIKISKDQIKPQNNLEYKNTGSLGGDRDIEREIKERFIQTFKLGTVYSGSEIKSMIREIYEDLGVEKTPKISDIQNYFVTTSVSNISSYRIELRK